MEPVNLPKALSEMGIIAVASANRIRELERVAEAALSVNRAPLAQPDLEHRLALSEALAAAGYVGEKAA